MSIPLLPESAPFSPSQRAWLNGFFAGVFNLDAAGANGVTSGADVASKVLSSVQEAVEEEDFPWHDPTLSIDERVTLAEGRPKERVLMAAMAQLDCGACGYLCQSYSEAIAQGAERDITKCVPGGKDTAKKLKQILADQKWANDEDETKPVVPAEPKAGGPRPAKDAAYDRTNPFPSAILDVRPLNRKDSEKDVRFVSLSLRGSGLTYDVGDALGVYPENDPELVETILGELSATGEEPTVTPEGWIVPSRVALAKAYVVNTLHDDFIALLGRIAHDDEEAKRLKVLCEDDADDYLSERDVLDVVRDFPSARTSIGEMIAALPPLRPRLYSISSSLKAHPDQVHLTIGVVRYNRRGCDRLRKGVASTFLSERTAIGHKVGVFVQKAHGFAPPQDASRPMIMVGPGTGIAPFRAFLQERQATGATGSNWLFFGDQREACDFLYRNELEEFQQQGVLTRLDTAFSRDSAQKVYVQHRMLENAAELWRWLQDGAHFYVCGDATRMAKDVDAALQRIVREQGDMSEAAAKEYVVELARSGRYQRDVY